MKTKLSGVASLVIAVGIGGTAAAQQPTPPTGAPPTPPPTPADPVPTPTPTPTPTPQPPPPAPTVVAPEPAPAPAPVDDDRPTMFSIGIGLGYQLPTSLETPNITSVRFRLPTGLTFEPQLIFAKTDQTVDIGTSTTDSITETGLGTVVRFPLSKRGRVDLEVLGAANIDSVNLDPEGEDDQRRTTTLSLAYGLAVTSWITSHWQVSLTAANPIVTWAKVRQENGPMSVTVTSETTFGLIFEPTVAIMVHLYH
ncbi:MAG TPA: hypothetical protein VFQ53_15880 [Kofleriaceae bacterium]|nr:hypothetical protein [Kofleriaceae bacterium]